MNEKFLKSKTVRVCWRWPSPFSRHGSETDGPRDNIFCSSLRKLFVSPSILSPVSALLGRSLRRIEIIMADTATEWCHGELLLLFIRKERQCGWCLLTWQTGACCTTRLPTIIVPYYGVESNNFTKVCSLVFISCCGTHCNNPLHDFSSTHTSWGGTLRSGNNVKQILSAQQGIEDIIPSWYGGTLIKDIVRTDLSWQWFCNIISRLPLTTSSLRVSQVHIQLMIIGVPSNFLQDVSDGEVKPPALPSALNVEPSK